MSDNAIISVTVICSFVFLSFIVYSFIDKEKHTNEMKIKVSQVLIENKADPELAEKILNQFDPQPEK